MRELSGCTMQCDAHCPVSDQQLHTDDYRISLRVSLFRFSFLFTFNLLDNVIRMNQFYQAAGNCNFIAWLYSSARHRNESGQRGWLQSAIRSIASWYIEYRYRMLATVDAPRAHACCAAAVKMQRARQYSPEATLWQVLNEHFALASRLTDLWYIFRWTVMPMSEERRLIYCQFCFVHHHTQ